MSEELVKARELVAAGDVSAVMRHLRFTAARIPMADLAGVVGWSAGQAGFDDLVTAAAAVAANPEDPQALYDFGYAGIERGVSYLSIPALSEALRLAPDSSGILTELVCAMEIEGRHRDAMVLLSERDATLRDWPDRYFLVFNAVMAGDLEVAFREFDRLSDPDEQWRGPRDRIGRMLSRARHVRTFSSLGETALRDWHFVVAGGILATLAPYGFDKGMTGRHAFTQDGYGNCRAGLRRLSLILDAAGAGVKTVSLLPERSSRILGLAAAEVLGLPAVPFDAARPDTVVVAYDLNDVDPEVAGSLRQRVQGQILFEHATCWTDAPAVSADVSVLLGQTIIAPWAPRLGRQADGTTGQGPADDRAEEELAAEIVAADGELAVGDGATPELGDTAFSAFVARVAPLWLDGTRDRVRSPGPVGSSRFL
jgi:hypothetical protein